MVYPTMRLYRIECSNGGCAHRDRRDRMERHECAECPRRPAGCPACGIKLPAGDLQAHEERECAKRRVACPYAMRGCHDIMLQDQVTAHITHK